MFVFNSVLQGNAVDIKTGLPNPPHFSGISVSHSCLPPSYIFRLEGLSTSSTEYNSMFPCWKLPAFYPKREAVEFSGEPIKCSAWAGGYYRKEFEATGWRCEAGQSWPFDKARGRAEAADTMGEARDRMSGTAANRESWQPGELGQHGREGGLKFFLCWDPRRNASRTHGHTNRLRLLMLNREL